MTNISVSLPVLVLTRCPPPLFGSHLPGVAHGISASGETPQCGIVCNVWYGALLFVPSVGMMVQLVALVNPQFIN